MKKLLTLFLILGILLFPVIHARAYTPVTQYWKTYSIQNNSASTLTTYVSITAIRPNVDNIIGFAVTGIFDGESGERWCVIYDATASTELDTVLGEAESIDDSMNGMWFPYPRKLANGLAITQGCHSNVIIYYE